jgi:hypothetical protein
LAKNYFYSLNEKCLDLFFEPIAIVKIDIKYD